MLKPGEGCYTPRGQPVKLICGHEIWRTVFERVLDGEGYYGGCPQCAEEGIDMWLEEYKTSREIAYEKAFRELVRASIELDDAMGMPQLFGDSDDE